MACLLVRYGNTGATVFVRYKNAIRDAYAAFSVNERLSCRRRRVRFDRYRAHAHSDKFHGAISVGALELFERTANNDGAPVGSVSYTIDLEAYIWVGTHVLDFCS